MSHRLKSLFIIPLFFYSCRSTELPSSQGKDFIIIGDDIADKDVVCPPALRLAKYMLMPILGRVFDISTYKDYKIASLKPNPIARKGITKLKSEDFRPDENKNNYRFDVCENDDRSESKLMRIVMLSTVNSVYTLEKAIGLETFVGAPLHIYDDVHVKIPLEKIRSSETDEGHETDEVLLLIGRASSAPEKDDGFIVVGSILPKAGRSAEFLRRPLMGRLKPFEVSETACPRDALAERQVSWQVGTAKFNAILCENIGTSGTHRYDIAELSVVDDNPKLAKPIDFKIVTKDVAAEHSPFTPMVGNHHNTCDAIQLKLPEVTYAGISLSGNPPDRAECGKSPDFPLMPSGPTSSDKTLYNVKYGNHPPVEIEVRCGIPGDDCASLVR